MDHNYVDIFLTYPNFYAPFPVFFVILKYFPHIIYKMIYNRTHKFFPNIYCHGSYF